MTQIINSLLFGDIHDCTFLHTHTYEIVQYTTSAKFSLKQCLGKHAKKKS